METGCDSQEAVRTELPGEVVGRKKSVVVRHNRLKPRDDDPSFPVAAPNMSIPSSVASLWSDTDVQLPSRPSPLPRFAVLGGDSYLSPSRGRTGSGPATEALPDRDGEVGEPLVNDDVATLVVPGHVVPVPTLRRSERVPRPPDRFCP